VTARLPLLLEQAVLLRDQDLLARVLGAAAEQQWATAQLEPLRRVSEHPELAAWIAELSDLDGLRQLLRFLLSPVIWEGDELSVGLLTAAQPGALQFRHQVRAATARELRISLCLGRVLQLWRGTVEEFWELWFGAEPGLKPYPGLLLRAELQRQRGALEPLLRELAAAATLNRGEWNLRLWLAELLPTIGLVDEALLLLEQLPRTDARAAIDAELLALNISLAAERPDRAREAALRLSGLPLSEAQQQRLIPVLGRLNLPDVLRSVEVRLGRSVETRTGVLARRLQAAESSGDRQLAGELAWELLRLSSGGSLFSGYRPTDDRDDGGERALALRSLAKSGRATELAERYEAMLREAPDSLPLLELLAELDDAAGNREQLARRQDRIAAVTGRVSPGRRRRALELENSGDVSAACDEYLQILEEDAAAFAAEAETFFQAFERAKRSPDFLQAVLQLDAAFWRDNGRLLATATAAAAGTRNNGEIQPEVAAAVQQAATRLLADDNTRRLGLGMLMNRTGVLSDEQLQAALQTELEQLERPVRRTQAEQLTACSELLQLVASLERRELLREVSARAVEPNRPAAARVFSLAAAVQLGARSEVDQASSLLLAEATIEFADAPESAAELLWTLLQRLEGQGPEWVDVRERLLRGAVESGLAQGAAGEQLRGALAEILQQSGRGQEARQLLLERLLASRATAAEQSAAGVREILKTAEQVQHSGYPVESAELLAGISQHDLAQFTKTLEADRAAAFRSRWNAAVQWSVRQMVSERLTAWFASAVEQAAAAPDRQQGARPRNPLLLVPSGPGDPAETDPQQLQQLTVNSLLLEATWRGDFAVAELREQIRGLAGRLLELPAADVGLLCAAAALADRAECVAERDRLITRLLAASAAAEGGQPATAVAPAGPRSTQGDEFAALQLAGLVPLAERLLADGRIDAAMAERLWDVAAAAAERPGPRLVRLALLNRAAGAASRAGTTTAAQRYRQRADQLIAEQQRAGVRAEVAAESVAELIRGLLNPG
jgi:hypothetical protein